MKLELDYYQAVTLRSKLKSVKESEKELPQCFRNDETLDYIITELEKEILSVMEVNDGQEL